MDRILKGKIKGKNTTKVVRFGNVKSVGVGNVGNFIKNFREISSRINRSRNSGFYIESISLQLQLIDLWLKELVKEKTGKQFVFGEKYFFGDVIKKSQQLLPPQLYEKVKEFNKIRIKAIHNFIYGDTDYEEIKSVSEKYNSLHVEVFQFVVKEISKGIS